jgi:hypothetical protein
MLAGQMMALAPLAEAPPAPQADAVAESNRKKWKNPKAIRKRFTVQPANEEWRVSRS